MKFIRVLVTIVVATLVWVVTHLLVEEILGIIAMLICGDELYRNGICYADYWPSIESPVLVLGVGFSAMMTILSAVWLNRENRILAAKITYGTGMFAASVLVVSASFSAFVIACWASALITGFFTLKCIRR
ncbi:hypothetical protein [Vibrio maerlii]|uniref:hypothetical protein n=1 Tax=Vibrio maerlii TaxID=2231648 RepID=UPI000E3C580F|nr:hypothetical protein [Vibrio maerlii]